MRSRWLRAGPLLVLAALSACRTLPPTAPLPTTDWQSRRAQLQALKHFEFRGRVAVAAAGSGFNASLHWVQDAARSQVSLEGPLGMGAVQLLADGDELQVINSRGEHLSSAAARAELSGRLGFDLPVASLRYWLLGVPDPARPAQEEVDAQQQRLAGLTQDGWRIQYLGYEAAGADALPARVTLERDTVRVRLVIDQWLP